MKIRYIGPFAEVTGSINCRRGEAIEVSDRLAERLLRREDKWEAVEDSPAIETENTTQEDE